MKKYVIGVDIGGTKIAAGVVSAKSGKLKHKVVLPTLASKGRDASIAQVFRSIKEVLDISSVTIEDIEGIGLCAPGPLDPVAGIVHNPPNLPGWKEVPLSAMAEKEFKVKARLENDANAAGMAEVKWGAAKGYKNVFYVTVSTGIGTAIIIDGKIYHGKNGMAGEGGHMTINYDGKDEVCGCGNTGCIEALASGTNTEKALIKKIKENPELTTSLLDMADGRPEKITMVTIGEAAREGDELALETIKNQGRLIGIWLGSMISLLDPEIIVIGGGVSMLGDILFSEIRANIATHSINIFADKTPVVPAELKTNVGILGAASILMV
ncbi:MAG: ROK family protein [Candidatus Omnitrophota bacterium]